MHGTLSIGFLATLCALAGAGPIDPPSGPVTGTMKTLNEVEPRIAINEVNTPGDADSLFKITQPGSYYVTGNVTVPAGKNGIEVAVSGVTIDLRGFEFQGVDGAWNGVAADANRTGLAVRNGTFRNFDGSGVNAWSADCATVVGVRVFDGGGKGIAVGSRSMVADCISNGNHTGIVAGPFSTISACTAGRNTQEGFDLGSGVAATECVAEGNGGFGIRGGDAVSRCVSAWNSSGFFGGGAFEGCSAESNDFDGFYLTGAATVTGCVAAGNGRHGINLVTGAGRISGNACTGNGFDSTGGSGIYVGDGTKGCTIADNTCSGNDHGIFVVGTRNQILGNSLADNSVSGLTVTGQYNLITGNKARNTTGVNWNIVAGNRAGLFVAPPLGGAVNGATGGAGSGTTDPFANLSY